MILNDHPNNPVPDGARCGRIFTSDGVGLRYAFWKADANTSKGTVCILHGRSEFIEKYYEVISELLIRGLSVATLDWRGQGGSDRLLTDHHCGHVHDFSEYGEDLDAFVRQIVLADCPSPYFCLAHSMGGTIMLRSSITQATRFDRIIVTAPMIRLSCLPVAPGLVQFVSGLSVHIGLAHQPVPGINRRHSAEDPFEKNILSSDPERYQRLYEISEQFDGIMIGGPTFGWVYAAGRAMKAFKDPKFLEEISTPMLMIGSSNDKVVSTRAIHDLCNRIRSAHFIMVPGARHEVLMEQDRHREQFWAAFDAFIPGSNELPASIDQLHEDMPQNKD